MSITKVAGNNNTFEWKLNIKENNASDLTGDVSIDGYNVQVTVDHILYSEPTQHLCQFRLHTDCNSIFPVSYTLSILDHEGHAFLGTKGKLPRNVAKNQLPMIFDVSFLRACNIINGDILTVRFTLLTRHSELYAEHQSHPTEGAFANSLDTLSKDFSTFYEGQVDTDCVLKVSNDQFHAHRAILSARSTFFCDMFHQDTPESRSGEVDILEVEATVFRDVLFYIYSGKVKGLTVDTATSMYTVADKYGLLQLRTECVEFLKREMTLENFSEVALLPDVHGDLAVQLGVALFIQENFYDVMKSAAWQKLMIDNIVITNKLLTSALEASIEKQRKTIKK